jgi:RNA polymerase sigma factor (sigma-70 family)
MPSPWLVPYRAPVADSVTSVDARDADMTAASDPLHLLRELAPQVLGALTRRSGNFADADDAVQEALIAAAAHWPVDGIPTNPRGWLYHVATRRLADQHRRDAARQRREEAVAAEVPDDERVTAPRDTEAERDDTLLVLFMCCHPVLNASSAIALTLRSVGGLTTAEIARAFFVPEATMAQRISRAKSAITASRIPFAHPDEVHRAPRLDAVLHVLYLIFTEGYASTAGPDLKRADLSAEAIRLTREVHAMLPANAEVTGLLALMLLTDARRDARTGDHGELIPLDEQDRSRWDPRAIAEGIALVSSALPVGPIGAYQVQAAIAAVHDEAASVGDTDWRQILALYEVLLGLSDNPMVALSHAIAAAMVHGPAAGLELMQSLEQDARIVGHYRLDAVRGHLYAMSGDNVRAVASYRIAADRTPSLPERDYLTVKAARLAASSGQAPGPPPR